MSKRAPTEYNLFVKAEMAKKKKTFADQGVPFRASQVMQEIGILWRQTHDVVVRSPKSAGCNDSWAQKCASQQKLCSTGATGRRSCGRSPEAKKAAAQQASARYRAAKKALLNA